MNGPIVQHTLRAAICMFVAIHLVAGPTLGPVALGSDAGLSDSSGIMVPSWKSVTLSLTTYNPTERPDQEPGKPEKVIAVSGQVHILDANDLIAVADANTAVLCAFDQDGQEVLFDPNAYPKDPNRAWMLGAAAKPFSTRMKLDPNQAAPSILSALDFTVDALYGQPFTFIDLPFAPTDDWMELFPGFRTLVEATSSQDGRCTCSIKEEIVGMGALSYRSFDPEDGVWEERWPMSGLIFKLSDHDLIYHVDIVDLEGKLVQSGGGRMSAHGGGGVIETSREITLSQCTDTTTLQIRYTIAVDPYEAQIPLTLAQIPVPGL